MKSLKSTKLKHKLWIMYALMSILPVLFFIFIIVTYLLPGSAKTAPPDSSIFLSLGIGLAAILVMSVAALIIMYRSIKSLEKVSKTTEIFVKNIEGEKMQLITTDDEIEKISHYFNTMAQEIQHKVIEVNEYAQQLAVTHKKVSQIAIRDSLTGLYDQAYAKERLRIEVIRAQEFGHPLSVLMFDIDNFKKLNDTCGHLAGDQALRDIAGLMIKHSRAIDIPARYGGEEFLIVLPETSSNQARDMAENIRRAIGAHTFKADKPDETVRLTISVGIGVLSEQISTPEQMIYQADKHLYQAKSQGKNRVSTSVIIKKS